MSDEAKKTVPSAEGLRLLFGATGLGQLAEQMRATREGVATMIAAAVALASPSPAMLRALEASRRQLMPSPDVLRAFASVGAVGRFADEMGRIDAARNVRLREIGRQLAERRAEDEEMRIAFRAWRASADGRAFFERVAEARQREEAGGVEEFDTTA